MQEPKSLKAVLFDLDGTLIDTAVEFIVVVQSMRDKYGLPPTTSESKIRESVSDGANALIKLALEIDEFHPKFSFYRQTFLDIYKDLAGKKCKPYNGIKKSIKWLGEQKIKWGIATNKPRIYTDAILRENIFNPMPNCVICPEDIRNPKPSPEALLLACEILGCNPKETVYIGDHARDIEAGNTAGMYTIFANYGYISARDRCKKIDANAFAQDPKELKKLLTNAFPYCKRG